MTSKHSSAPRCAVLVGTYLSGKTSLLESMLALSGAVNRKGTIKESNTVGDGAPEARARQMSTELSIASAEYLGEPWTFIDCPGSVELVQEAKGALMVADVAVVVCEPEAGKALTVAPLLKFLDDHGIPHIIFINKMDVPGRKVKASLDALQEVSARPLVLREIPIREGDKIVGHVDLVSERAWKWTEDQPSELIEIPEELTGRENSARTELLETLADFDDVLLEGLLEDTIPPTDEVYSSLAKDLQEEYIVPVFFGSAEQDHGIRRLLKALRHEVPDTSKMTERLGIDPTGEACAQVFKNLHAGHTGKLSFARVLRGEITDGMTLNGHRLSGLYHMFGQKQIKRTKAVAGDVVGLGRLEDTIAGNVVSASGQVNGSGWPEAVSPLYSLAIHAEQRADEVKLTGVLSKLVEEDASLSYAQVQDTNELLLWGQGDMHLQVALDRLRNRYNLAVSSHKPQVPYKETIRKTISQHARYKKQSGGHGQFGDVHLDIKPLPRGSGFNFDNSITGGVVPKQYIPAVETGVKEYMRRGPLGFQVVDIAVILTDGQFHAVDSSDMAFKAAAQLGMREGLPKCNPVLLEPIFQVDITLPTEFTSKVQRLVSGRRGNILGFTAKENWKGWDVVSVQLPQSETHDLINELRSMTMGVGNFKWEFDHLQELTGKPADQVVGARQASGH